MKKLIYILGSAFLFFSCNSGNKEPQEEMSSTNQSNYEVASERYSELSQEALDKLAAMDFDGWGNMMADDVQYFFPDGDADTRKILKGKEEVLSWWKNWKETSGINKTTFTNPVFIPVRANQELNYSGLKGVIVLSYFSNEMIYDGQPVNVRMNFVTHFNKDSLIDRYYTYYDRTPIINTVDANVLEIVVPKQEKK